MKNLIIRTLTGAVYVLLLVGCTVYSPVSAFFFFALAAAGTLWEFGSLMNTYEDANMPRPINAMAGVVLVAGVWLSAIASPQTAQMFALYGLLMLYIIISELYRKADNPLK
ncbi:MAG: phosphatidate cytidylyltransferase, partial [Bacteroidaceae bacterium]|nr:phosphatidate cytidylyltransferase [Bacteroidaceae bacterium]